MASQFKEVEDLGSIDGEGKGAQIRVRVVEMDGERFLDIRTFVESAKYTGPTKKGVMVRLDDRAAVFAQAVTKGAAA